VDARRGSFHGFKGKLTAAPPEIEALWKPGSWGFFLWKPIIFQLPAIRFRGRTGFK